MEFLTIPSLPAESPFKTYELQSFPQKQKRTADFLTSRPEKQKLNNHSYTNPIGL